MSSPHGCRLILSILAIALAAQLPASAKDRRIAKLEAIIHRSDYRYAHWGILVVDSASGKSIYECEADRMFIPASTVKLYSCAAALAALGPDYKFVTPVYRRGAVENGRLKGDLILVAQGDLPLGGRSNDKGTMVFKNHDHMYANFEPNSTAERIDVDPLAGLKSLAQQVKKAGIHTVDGDVLVDDRLFTKDRNLNSLGERICPIAINDNLIDIVVSPASKVGEPARVQMWPETKFVQADSVVTTAEDDVLSHVSVEAAGPERFVVRGRISRNSSPLLRIYPVHKPVAFARALFIETLRREGVVVDASPLQSPQRSLPQMEDYFGLTRIAAYTSAPFSELIKVTLKVSHNLYADAMPLLIAAKNDRKTLWEGLRLERQFLTDLGVSVDAICLADGAGGASADSVTPRSMIQLLQGMAKRPDYPTYRDALPVLGVDGTLAEAVPARSPARGKVRAKTGTLVWYDAFNDRFVLRCKSLAGVLTTAKGRELFFALFVNNVPLPQGASTGREGKVLAELCEILCQDES